MENRCGRLATRGVAGWQMTNHDDHRAVAAYMANAAALVVRAGQGTTDTRLAELLPVLAHYVDRWRVLERDARAAELVATGNAGPGWPGPCPDGVDWSDWLATNNVD